MTDNLGLLRGEVKPNENEAKRPILWNRIRSETQTESHLHLTGRRDTRFRLLKSEIYGLKNSRFKPCSARVGREIKDIFQVAYKRI